VIGGSFTDDSIQTGIAGGTESCDIDTCGLFGNIGPVLPRDIVETNPPSKLLLWRGLTGDMIGPKRANQPLNFDVKSSVIAFSPSEVSRQALSHLRGFAVLPSATKQISIEIQWNEHKRLLPVRPHERMFLCERFGDLVVNPPTS
jgi:hypothetical protein